MKPKAMLPCSPELRLLSYLSRVLPREEERLKVRRLLEEPTDWERFIQLAMRHGVASVIFHGLAQHECALPKQVAESLRQHARNAAIRGMALASELVKVQALLGQEGLAVTAYKGPALSKLLYGNVGVREYSDVDLFVRSTDFRLARETLCAAGFQPTTQIPREKQGRYVERLTQCEFSHPGGIRVDLHWQLAPRHLGVRISEEWLWSDLGSVSIHDNAVRVFKPEKLVLALCIHGAKHAWERLKWLCDLGNLVRSYPDLDWDAITADADRFGASRILALGLALAQGLLGAAAPLDGISDPEVNGLAETCVRRLETSAAGIPKIRDRWLFLLRLRKGGWQKLKAIFDFLSDEVKSNPAGERPEQRVRSGIRRFWRVCGVLLDR